MREIQLFLFTAGLLCFVAAVFFVGRETGDTLWRAGVALLLADIACVMLWPPHAREPH